MLDVAGDHRVIVVLVIGLSRDEDVVHEDRAELLAVAVAKPAEGGVPKEALVLSEARSAGLRGPCRPHARGCTRITL